MSETVLVLFVYPMILSFVISCLPLYFINKTLNRNKPFGVSTAIKGFLFGFLLWCIGIVVPIIINGYSEHPWFSGEAGMGLGLILVSSLAGFTVTGIATAIWSIKHAKLAVSTFPVIYPKDAALCAFKIILSVLFAAVYYINLISNKGLIFSTESILGQILIWIQMPAMILAVVLASGAEPIWIIMMVILFFAYFHGLMLLIRFVGRKTNHGR